MNRRGFPTPVRCCHAGAAWLGGIAALAAAEVRDDFATSPWAHGWQRLGDPALAEWNSAAGRLDLNWDSRRPDSFVVRPLARTLSIRDRFSFTFDWQLDAAGPRPESPRTNTLQLTVALVRLAQLPGGYPLRTRAGVATNLIDFSFFPRTDFGLLGSFASVSPSAYGRSSRAFSFNNLHNLADGTTHRIRCAWNPALRRLETTLDDGALAVQPTDPLADDDDFAVDAFAIIAWNEIPTPRDSLKAGGWIDDVVLELPGVEPLTVGPLRFEAADRTVRFQSSSGPHYALEASGNLRTWDRLGEATPGTGSELQLNDLRAAEFAEMFYRVVIVAGD